MADQQIVSRISEEEMQEVYNWVDEIPLSRPKKNIARDFSDAVLIAEVVKHFQPQLVELHNYSNAHSVQQKTYNWTTLNHKVFSKLGLQTSPKDIKDCVEMVPETVERVLFTLRYKLDEYSGRKKARKIASAQRRSMQEMRIPQHNNGQYSNERMMGGQNHGQNGIFGNQQQQQIHGMIQQQMNSQPPMQQPMAEIQNNVMYAQQQHQQNLAGQQMSNMKPENHFQYEGNNFNGLNQAQGGLDQVVQEKDTTINQLRETVEILELKIKKLEQLVKLKDAKIGNLSNKLNSVGIM